jgi:hypothetical protein
MAEELEETRPSFKEIELRITRSPELGLIYANHVQVAYGQKSEVQLFFGQILSPIASETVPSQVICKQDVAVALTLEEATNLKNLLDELIPKFWTLTNARKEKEQAKKSE